MARPRIPMTTTDFMPAAVTGEGFSAIEMDEGPLVALTFRDQQCLAAGCLDAPEFIVLGGARAVIIQGELEAVTPRTQYREIM